MIRICIYLKCRIRIRKTDSAFCLQDLGDFVSCIMHATPFSTSNPPVSPLVYPCSGNVLLVQNIPQVLKGQFHETHSVKQSRSRWIRYYFLVSAGP